MVSQLPLYCQRCQTDIETGHLFTHLSTAHPHEVDPYRFISVSTDSGTVLTLARSRLRHAFDQYVSELRRVMPANLIPTSVDQRIMNGFIMTVSASNSNAAIVRVLLSNLPGAEEFVMQRRVGLQQLVQQRPRNQQQPQRNQPRNPLISESDDELSYDIILERLNRINLDRPRRGPNNQRHLH